MHFFFDSFEAYQSAIFTVGGLGAIGLLLMVLSDFGERKLVRLERVGKGLFWTGMICAFAIYAGIKTPTPKVTTDTGLKASAHFIAETNVVNNITNYNYIGVSFEWIHQLPVMATDRLWIAARQHGLTNSTDWVEIYDGLVSDAQAEIYLDNSTNYEYYVYAAYVTPEVTATNGVYHCNALSPEPGIVIPLQASVVGVSENASTNITAVSLTEGDDQ